MKTKKILIFSLAYYPKHVGGAEVAVKEITDRISADDIEFHMVTNRFDSALAKTEQIGNVMVHRIGLTKNNPQMADLRKFPLHLNKFIYQFLVPFTAWRLNRTHNFNAMWGVMAHSTAVPLAIAKFLMTKMPYVLTLQEGDPIPHIMKKVRLVSPLFKRGFRKATVIQPISTFLGKWARDMGFKGDVELVPNAVNTAHFSQEYSEAELDELKKKLGKKDNEKYIITTSRLVKKNAADDVIKALPSLSENIKFVILGTGPDEQMLQELAKKEGVSERVIFLGQVDHAEMPKYLKISDIFIRPSLSEGFGNSFVEAM
ncbi:glycosyltransferase, partial [Patescibacteria group bacterium]